MAKTPQSNGKIQQNNGKDAAVQQQKLLLLE